MSNKLTTRYCSICGTAWYVANGNIVRKSPCCKGILMRKFEDTQRGVMKTSIELQRKFDNEIKSKSNL